MSFNRRDYLDLWALAHALEQKGANKQFIAGEIKRMVEEVVGQLTIFDCTPLPQGAKELR